MVNHPWEYHLDTSPHSSCMVLQTYTFNHKIISVGIGFSHSHRTPLHWLACCTLNYSYYWFPLYLSHFSTNFNITCTTIYLIHALEVQHFLALLYHLKLLEGALHSRVKDSVTNISIVICSSYFKGRLLY